MPSGKYIFSERSQVCRTVHAAAKSFKRLAFFLLLPLLLSYFSSGCSRQKDLIEEGEQYLSAGDLDRSMERFEMASRISDSPESQAGVGVVLSLKRMTVVTGLTMLEKSLGREFNLTVLGRLFTLYLDMGLTERASAAISATRLGEDRYFLPEIEILRKTLQCLTNTGNVDGQSIREVETDDPSYLDRRRSYAARCDVVRLTRLVQSYYPYRIYRNRGGPAEDVFNPELYFLLQEPEGQKFEEGQQSWKQILKLEPITRCELNKIYGIPGNLLEIKPQDCIRNYPHSLVILRETPPKLKESDFYHFPDKLFDDSQFYPDFTPLPEYYYPGEPNEEVPLEEI